MPVPLYSSETREQPRAAGDIVTINLPVNPISFLLLTLQVTAAAVAPTLANLLAAVTRVEIMFKGTTVWGGSLADLWRVTYKLWGQGGHVIRFNQVAANLTRITIPLPFTRVPFWMEEAWPSTRFGELQLRLTYAAAFTNFTLPVETVTSVQILDANPSRFIRVTTVFDNAVAIGDRAQVDLPIGNPILGVLMFGTTVPDGAMTSTIRRLRLLMDNVEFVFSQVEHDALHYLTHLGIQDRNVYAPNVGEFENYLYLQFDPFKDGAWALKTEGRSRVMLEFRADAADVVRVLPVELVSIAAA